MSDRLYQNQSLELWLIEPRLDEINQVALHEVVKSIIAEVG
ncbi:MAG: hypothetical protein ABIB72_01265 [Candidatus Falkowbacteria bacterium]